MKEAPGSRPIDSLAAQAAAGDARAFTRLWDTHVEALKAYLHGLLRNLDDFYIDDICSRSFEKAFRQIDSFDNTKSRFFTWLKTIAHNTALDTLEQENRLRSKYVRIDDAAGATTVEGLGSEAPSPIENIIRDEDDARKLACIEGLPDLYREVARRRLVDGLQYQEIAEETGLELNTVRTRIRRAKALIEKMKENGDEE
ncbi:MAG: sigma-70 family RNA polymerase sigma factor [Bacteroidales bacterium]|nr:sigma-70 family RNA polymerase sigma factor [Bacteroidales bacterium]